MNLRGADGGDQARRSRGRRAPRRLRWPRPLGPRPVASSARRRRCGEPGGLSWPRRAVGRPWRAPANQTRGSGAAPKARRRAARGARSRGGTESGGKRGCPELRRGTAPAGGRRAPGGGRGCPARVSRRCVALKRHREQQRRRRARPRLRGGAGGGGGGAGSSLGPGKPRPKQRPRQAPAQRPGPLPSRPAPGACLPGRG